MKINEKDLVIKKVYVVVYGARIFLSGSVSYDQHIAEFSKRSDAIDFIKDNFVNISYYQINTQEVIRIGNKVFKTEGKARKMQYVNEDCDLETFMKQKDKIR